jgi:hypothetical protein
VVKTVFIRGPGFQAGVNGKNKTSIVYIVGLLYQK